MLPNVTCVDYFFFYVLLSVHLNKILTIDQLNSQILVLQ